MGTKHALLGLVLVSLIAVGCQVTPPGDVECTPPAVRMLDVNGNPVCVMPEIAEEAPEAIPEEMPVTPVEEPEVAPEEEAPPVTGEVVVPIEEIEVEELPTKTVTEGELVSFPDLAAVDPDGDPVTFTFTEPLDENGEWQTEIGDAGEYRVTISASDGKDTASQDVLIIVLSANEPPVIEALGPIEVSEGGTITLEPVVTDPDGDEVTITYDGWMTSDTKRTGFEDAGEYIVTITATDGINTVTRNVRIAVADVNRPPVLAPIADLTVTEGQNVVIEPTATDPDGDEVSITFSQPLDEAGSWQTAKGDAGEYFVEVTASDGLLADKRSFTLTVQSLNKPPVIELRAEITVQETQTVTLDPVVTDPDGDEVTITYTGWMTSNTRVTTFEDAGEYLVTVVADDGTNTVSKDVKIVVTDKNQRPRFVGI